MAEHDIIYGPYESGYSPGAAYPAPVQPPIELRQEDGHPIIWMPPTGHELEVVEDAALLVLHDRQGSVSTGAARTEVETAAAHADGKTDRDVARTVREDITRVRRRRNAALERRRLGIEPNSTVVPSERLSRTTSEVVLEGLARMMVAGEGADPDSSPAHQAVRVRHVWESLWRSTDHY